MSVQTRMLLKKELIELRDAKEKTLSELAKLNSLV